MQSFKINKYNVISFTQTIVHTFLYNNLNRDEFLPWRKIKPRVGEVMIKYNQK